MDYGTAITFDDLASVELEGSKQLIYDREVGLRLLYEDPDSGARHYLVRCPAGTDSFPHSHTAAHTIVVLEGRLEVNDQVIGPGSYCHFPGGETMWHAPTAAESCLFLVIFDGPFDVQLVE